MRRPTSGGRSLGRAWSRHWAPVAVGEVGPRTISRGLYPTADAGGVSLWASGLWSSPASSSHSCSVFGGDRRSFSAGGRRRLARGAARGRGRQRTRATCTMRRTPTSTVPAPPPRGSPSTRGPGRGRTYRRRRWRATRTRARDASGGPDVVGAPGAGSWGGGGAAGAPGGAVRGRGATPRCSDASAIPKTGGEVPAVSRRVRGIRPTGRVGRRSQGMRCART